MQFLVTIMNLLLLASNNKNHSSNLNARVDSKDHYEAFNETTLLLPDTNNDDHSYVTLLTSDTLLQ